MMFCTWACSHSNVTANPSTEVKETWGLPRTMYCLSTLLKYTLQKTNYAIAAWYNPKFVSLFATRAPKAKSETLLQLDCGKWCHDLDPLWMSWQYNSRRDRLTVELQPKVSGTIKLGDRMGNSLSSEHRHFLQLLQCLLKSKGISYTQGQIEDFTETVIWFNPWFPEHGTLYPDSWK
jgi:hypothetical protein